MLEYAVGDQKLGILGPAVKFLCQFHFLRRAARRGGAGVLLMRRP
jgi:hypothetical protein